MLARNADTLERDTQEFVLHYLNHDEHEMAFEGLFLDLMKLGRFQSSFDIAHAVHLARTCGWHCLAVIWMGSSRAGSNLLFGHG